MFVWMSELSTLLSGSRLNWVGSGVEGKYAEGEGYGI